MLERLKLLHGMIHIILAVPESLVKNRLSPLWHFAASSALRVSLDLRSSPLFVQLELALRPRTHCRLPLRRGYVRLGCTSLYAQTHMIP